jgi:hypothetical protein
LWQHRRAGSFLGRNANTYMAMTGARIAFAMRHALRATTARRRHIVLITTRFA